MREGASTSRMGGALFQLRSTPGLLMGTKAIDPHKSSSVEEKIDRKSFAVRSECVTVGTVGAGVLLAATSGWRCVHNFARGFSLTPIWLGVFRLGLPKNRDVGV